MDGLNAGILLILGIGLFGGVLSAAMSQRIRVPQVVGYIVLGVILGETGLGYIGAEDVLLLRTFTFFALGIIGFMVGGELQASTFRDSGRQYISILLSEGLLTFTLVVCLTSLFLYWIMGDVIVALAAGVVFGAVGTAKDPASTMGVLWEYRARGSLTTAIIAIIALGDAMALTLYGISTSIAQILTGGEASWGAEIRHLVIELGGSVVLGGLGGVLLTGLIRFLPQPDRTLAMAVGVILLAIGLCAILGLDVILATMALGAVLVNLAPRRSRDLFNLVRSFSSPIYVIFFVLVGARLAIGHMPGWLWGLVALYVLGSVAGKYVGAYMGARVSGAEASIRSYVGMGLFAQGGVAVGLSIVAGQHLTHISVTAEMSLGDMVVFVITASTIVLQLTSPSLVKFAIQRAGELGRNITDEDVVAEWTVADVMARNVTPIPEYEPLRAVVNRFSESDYLCFPVVNEEGRLVGVLRLETLKDILPERSTWDWLVAGDVAEPPLDKLLPTMPLQEALDMMRNLDVEQIPVVKDADEELPVGFLDQRVAHRKVKEEVFYRQHGASRFRVAPTS